MIFSSTFFSNNWHGWYLPSSSAYGYVCFFLSVNSNLSKDIWTKIYGLWDFLVNWTAFLSETGKILLLGINKIFDAIFIELPYETFLCHRKRCKACLLFFSCINCWKTCVTSCIKVSAASPVWVNLHILEVGFVFVQRKLCQKWAFSWWNPRSCRDVGVVQACHRWSLRRPVLYDTIKVTFLARSKNLGEIFPLSEKHRSVGYHIALVRYGFGSNWLIFVLGWCRRWSYCRCREKPFPDDLIRTFTSFQGTIVLTWKVDYDFLCFLWNKSTQANNYIKVG